MFLIAQISAVFIILATQFSFSPPVEATLLKAANFFSTSPHVQVTETASTDNEQALALDQLDFTKTPIKVAPGQGPKIPAASAIAIDAGTKKTLFEQNRDAELAIASITKVMTALIALENISDLSQPITIDQTSALTPGSSADLITGQKITALDLIHGALISSGNDASVALARHVSGSTEEFVKLMNAKASDLGLKHTHYGGVTGLDEEGNHSTVFELALLLDYAFKNDLLAQISQKTEYEMTDHATSSKYKIYSTNELLESYLPIIGAKTGFTDEAGPSLAAVIEEDGHRIIIVVLNAQDRFHETKEIADWVYRAYDWR